MARHRGITVKGKWWLWIFCAYWKLMIKNSTTVTSSSSFRKKRLAMALLDGQKLTGIKVNPVTGTTDFTFDLGARLQARRFEKDDSDIWTLYKPNGYVLGIRGDGTFTYCSGTTPLDKKKPRLIQMPNNTDSPSGRTP
jgi:hypothetical protein